jgi:plastocyanin
MPDSITEMRPIARRMVLRATTAAVSTLLMIGLARHPSAAPESATIDIANFTFAPAELAVAPGATVTWTNHDDIPHTVTSSDGAFKSPALDTDESFSFTFARGGSYQYFCSLHPHMVGTVTVG